jgi:hypothetical protein
VECKGTISEEDQEFSGMLAAETPPLLPSTYTVPPDFCPLAKKLEGSLWGIQGAPQEGLKLQRHWREAVPSEQTSWSFCRGAHSQLTSQSPDIPRQLRAASNLNQSGLKEMQFGGSRDCVGEEKMVGKL